MREATRFAEISITSNVLSPEAITAHLGLVPDQRRTKGTADKRVPPYDTNDWALREQGDCAVIPPELVERLIERAAPAVNVLQGLVADGTCKIHLSIWVLDACDSDDVESDVPAEYVGPSFTLEADVVAWVSSVGASLSVEFY